MYSLAGRRMCVLVASSFLTLGSLGCSEGDDKGVEPPSAGTAGSSPLGGTGGQPQVGGVGGDDAHGNENRGEAGQAGQEAAAGEAGASSAQIPLIVDPKGLANSILTNPDMAATTTICRAVLADGFNAGAGYPQVWIRDLNTFIEMILDQQPAPVVREALLRFFHFQGLDYVSYGGVTENIVDGCDDSETGNPSKNTAETDQETSLVQAVRKYVDKTGDRSILDEVVDGESVRARMGDALHYLLSNRFSEKYQLLWGATTADWGDNQPEDDPGASLDTLTHPAIDVYDNAMFILALRDYISLDGDPSGEWQPVLDRTRANVRGYLWDGHKFTAHVYLDRGSPFSFQAFFDESTVFYHGGTAVAMEADLLSLPEVAWSIQKMREDVTAAGAKTIGLNQYPPYPFRFFANPAQTVPYTYQNGGDWPWFGGRTIQQLVRLGFVQEAYDELRPMLKLFVRDQGISEWYTPDGEPKGSPKFKGAAGTIGKAINMLEAWANQHR